MFGTEIRSYKTTNFSPKSGNSLVNCETTKEADYTPIIM